MRLLLILICLALSACSLPFKVGQIRVGYGKVGMIAKSNDVIGKYEMNQCLPFAKDLHQRFKEAGVNSAIVAYFWQAGFHIGGHAIVLYEDEGRIYGMDNMTWRPRWLKTGKLQDMVEQFHEADGIVITSYIYKK